MSATSTPDLALVLEHLGVHVTHSTHREITAFCPVHTKYLGRPNVKTPAFSMNANTGAWLCFSCGAKGSLLHLVHELNGSAQDEMDVTTMVTKAKLDRINRGHADEKVDADEFEIDEIMYEQFEEVPRKMADARRLDRDLLWEYGVRYNPENKAWVLPIRTSGGLLLGWQEKKPGWVRNRPDGVPKSMTLFGLDMFEAETAVLVESPLDVVRMASAGVDGGLACYGVYVSKEQLQLVAKYATNLVIAFDNDSAGITMGRKLRKEGFPQPTGWVRWFAYPNDSDYKDPGDMPSARIREGVRAASIIPWWRRVPA